MLSVGQESYCNDRAIALNFENELLYRMCRDYPCHSDAYVVSGKLIAIGRIYAASPQRGAGKATPDIPSFFDHLADELQSSCLDEELAKFEWADSFSHDQLESVAATHSMLVKKIQSASRSWHSVKTDGWKARSHTSFASKYLHFHRPNMFPIMDRYSNAGLKCLHGHAGSDYKQFCSSLLDYAQGVRDGSYLRLLDKKLVDAGRTHEQPSPCLKCGHVRQERSLHRKDHLKPPHPA